MTNGTGVDLREAGEDGGSRHPRSRTRTIVVAVVVALGALLLVEQVGGAVTSSSSKVRRARWGTNFTPTATPPSNPGGTTGIDNPTPTGEAAITSIDQRIADADARVAAATGAAATGGSGVAAQAVPRLVPFGPRVCPILLREGAELIAQTNRLIAANPSLAPILLARLDRGLDRINTQLERFGCPISFG